LARAYEEFRHVAMVHAFQYRGRRTLLDPVTGVTFDLSPAAFAAAQALVSGATGRELAYRLGDVGLRAAENLLVDLLKLERQGMFRRCSLLSTKLHEKAVQSYLAHTPRKMMLLVSQTCNLRCVYCYAIESNFADTGRVMSLERAQDAIRFLEGRSGKRSCLTVTLFGGEPLVNFKMIRELVPWARRHTRSVGKRIHFTITTNGTLLSDEVIDFLIEHEFSILISLDGPPAVQNLHRPNVRGRGSFGMVAPKVKRLFDRHPHPEIIKVRATMTHQHHDTRALAGFFEEFGFDRIGLGANVGFSFAKGPFDLDDEDREEIYWQTEAVIDEFALEAVGEYRRLPYNPLAAGLVSLHKARNDIGPRPKIGCGVGRNDQAVDVDGKLYPCHRYVGMTAYEIGDIYAGIDRHRLEEYYRKLVGASVECGNCWATRWCTGHCPHYLSQASGRVAPPDTQACNMIRRNIERVVTLYDELTEEGLDWARLTREVGDD